MFQPKIMHYSLLIIHYSLFTIHYSLNTCVGRRRPRRPILRRNYPKNYSSFIIHYSLFIKYICRASAPTPTHSTKKLPKKIIHHSLFIIHYSLNTCVRRHRPRRPVLRRNHPKKLLIIHY